MGWREDAVGVMRDVDGGGEVWGWSLSQNCGELGGVVGVIAAVVVVFGLARPWSRPWGRTLEVAPLV